MDQNIPQIIGITGKKFNGKDTVGNYLISTYGYKRFAFADSLKEACKCVFGLSHEQLYGNEKECIDDYWNVSPREIFQFVGTQLFRDQIGTILPHVNNDIWVHVLKKQIIEELKLNPNQKIVITDIRFENELNMVKEINGTIVKVERCGVNNIDNHQSEIYVDSLNVNHIIYNNSTLHDLYKKIDEFITQ